MYPVYSTSLTVLESNDNFELSKSHSSTFMYRRLNLTDIAIKKNWGFSV